MRVWISFCLTIAYLASLGMLSFFIGEMLPKRWFHPDRFPFTAWKWERSGKFYDHFAVRRWKDAMPDMSRLFRKRMIPKRFGSCPTARQCADLAVETCRAEAVHAVLCLFAVPIVFFWNDRLVGSLIMLIDILANLSFVIIQRYNRPALVALEKRLRAREELRAAKRATEEESTHAQQNPDPVG